MSKDHSQPSAETSRTEIDPPSCTVVIPAWNAAPFLAESIESALAQGGPVCEVIVVDDGSEDRTREIAASYAPRGVRVLSQPNAGAPQARNRGLALAHAELVLFLDADDRLLAGAVARLADALRADARAVAAYGEADRMDAAARLAYRARRPWLAARPEGDVLRPLLRRSFIASPGAVLVRRCALVEVGGFLPGLPRAQDWELWCRLACRGGFVHVPPPAVLARRIHAESLGARRGTTGDASLPAIDAVFSNPEILARIPEAERTRLRRCQEASAWAAAARVCLDLQRLREARRALRQAIRLDPRLHDVLLLLRSLVPGTRDGRGAGRRTA
jgi:glycosyltransferase involved in cell wall biosynthesis